MTRHLSVVSGGREQYQEEQEILRERMGSAPGRTYIPPPRVRSFNWAYWIVLGMIAGAYFALR